MSRILLLRPPAVFSRATYSTPLTMPLSLAYLAASLMEAGHEADTIDGLGEGINRIERSPSYHSDVFYRGLSTPAILKRLEGIVSRRKINAIGVTAMFSQDWPHVEDLIKAVAARFPRIPIIVGGEHATAASEHILRTCAPVTHVALGEGERTIVEYAEFLDGKKSIEQVGGLALRRESGVAATNRRSRVGDPDSLPWPAWHLFDLEPYFRTGEGDGVERGRSMSMLATRGCPYECTFCSNPSMWTRRYVMRSAADVADEIAFYIKRYAISNIDFGDLTLAVNRRWVLEFCREIRRRRLEFSWQLTSGTRSEVLDAEVLTEMAAAGCSNMAYAPESGSARTLEIIKKRVQLPRLYHSIRLAKKSGIFVKCNLVIGFPKERRRDMWLTVWAALRFIFLGVDDVNLSIFTPYPGSKLYENLRSSGTIPEMNRRYFENLMVFMDLSKTTSYCESVGTAEIAFYRLFAMAAFYSLSYLLRPARILRTLRNWFRRKSDTVFEERFFALLRRRMLERKSEANA